jgi:nicotinamidase-related amidase
MKQIESLICILLIYLSSAGMVHAQKQKDSEELKILTRKRLPGETEKSSLNYEVQNWKPSETAIIICDMWDDHWCKGAAARVAEMAPFMNNVISIARNRGVMIVHAPSDVVGYYENYPARKAAQKSENKKASDVISRDLLLSEKVAVWPIDQSGLVCDCTPECRPGPPYPWTRQIDKIQISDNDIISDSGAEIGGLFYQTGIKNVILMGVHTNMCVIGRSFGLRNMVRLGMNVVLMRDLTDTMYSSKQWPQVNHFTGNNLINEYIETYVCPTIISKDFTGKERFRFKEDKTKTK